LTFIPRVLIYITGTALFARVCQLFLHSSFEEAFTAFASEDTVMITRGFVTTHYTGWTNVIVVRKGLQA
jgi:hypothetical protein